MGKQNGIRTVSKTESKGTPEHRTQNTEVTNDGSVLLHLPTEPREIDGVTTLSAVDHG